MPVLQGAAVLWVAPEWQDRVRPLVVSHGYGLGFRGEFLWQGTSDPTPWLAVPAALALMRAMGPEEVARYNHDLVREGAALLAAAWGPGRIVVGLGKDGESAGMLAVQLPDELWVEAVEVEVANRGLANGVLNEDGSGEPKASAAARPTRGAPEEQEEFASGHEDMGQGETAAAVKGGGANGSDDTTAPKQGSSRVRLPVSPSGAAALNLLLRQKYRIEVPVACVGGALWVRVSAQVYNKREDYGKLAAVIGGMRTC